MPGASERVRRAQREEPPDRTGLMHRRVVGQVAATVGVQVQRGLAIKHIVDGKAHGQVLSNLVGSCQVQRREGMHHSCRRVGRSAHRDPGSEVAAMIHPVCAGQDRTATVRPRRVSQTGG